MPKFAANLTMLYTDSPVLDRLARARASGFRYVELLFPYDQPIDTIATALDRHGLTMVLINMPPGDWAGGERGLASLPDRVDEFRAGIDRALDVAAAFRCQRVHCMMGNRDLRFTLEEQRATLVDNLRAAATAFAARGLTLTIEPLNSFDQPRFLVNTAAQAFDVQDAVGAPNLKVQYDVYHMQRMQGELAGTVQRYLERIGHIQIADNPGRGQPGTGEINYRFLLPFLDTIGYDGYVALEYVPRGTTEESLGWLAEYGFSL